MTTRGDNVSAPEPVHTASCVCGQLKLTARGEPIRVSLCHCFACQQRTGSVFGAQARFRVVQVRLQGDYSEYERIGDSGGRIVYSFCPNCGSTISYRLVNEPETVAVPLGAFCDPGSFTPRFSVYEDRMHDWVLMPPGIERSR